MAIIVPDEACADGACVISQALITSLNFDLSPSLSPQLEDAAPLALNRVPSTQVDSLNPETDSLPSL